MKKYTPKQQPIVDKDTTIEEFADLFMEKCAHLQIPQDASVIVSDDATAISLYKVAPFQVELYLVHPNISVPVHSHPNMESIVIRLGGGEASNISNVSNSWGTRLPKIKDSEVHGGSPLGYSAKGYAMLSVQKWPEGVQITSAAIHWKGETAGPKQTALIKSVHPNAIDINGYADVSKQRPMEVL